jgi:flagellar biosynthetic protein FlhB
MAPIMIGAVVVAVAANVAQVGFTINFDHLAPNLAALNPLSGLGRIFASGRGLAGSAMSVLKLTLVALVAYSAVHNRIAEILSVAQLQFTQIFALGSGLVYAIALRIAVLLLILALIDYIYQRFQMERDLRMTKQEVKEEMRRMEGDPKVKQRRRQIANQLAQKRLKKEVPTADVVLTNPTEFAVALKYDSATMHAPRVVAKGRGLMAARIREIAIEAGIPILERKPLARALYKLVDVGREIPEQFYSAIAEILAYVYSLTGKDRAATVNAAKSGVSEGVTIGS